MKRFKAPVKVIAALFGMYFIVVQLLAWLYGEESEMDRDAKPGRVGLLGQMSAAVGLGTTHYHPDTDFTV